MNCKSKHRIRISLRRDPAISATRISIGSNKLVYLLIADKKLKYKNGKSRIAYIGTTMKGVERITQSVAKKADQILSLHGVRAFQARVVTCRPRQRVKTWNKLERALLIAFREKYGVVPICNSHGKKMKAEDEFSYFSKDRLLQVLDDLA